MMPITVRAFISAPKQTDHYSTRHTTEGRVPLQVMTGDRYTGFHINTQQSAAEQSTPWCCYFCTFFFFSENKKHFSVVSSKLCFFQVNPFCQVSPAETLLTAPTVKRWNLRGALTCCFFDVETGEGAAVYLCSSEGGLKIGNGTSLIVGLLGVEHGSCVFYLW